MININENNIIVGDAFDVLPFLPEKSYNCIFLDPPFNLQLKTSSLKRPDGSSAFSVSDSWDNFSSFKEYDEFTYKYLKLIPRLMADLSSLWIMGMYHNIFRIGNILQDMGFWILNDVHWVKSNPLPNMRGTRLTNSTETLIWCVKNKNAKCTFNYQKLKEINNGKQMRSDWYFSVCRGHERILDENGKKIHSTQKPLKLIDRVLKCCTQENDSVLNFFAGVLTMGEACENNNLNYTLIDNNEKYIQYGLKRLKKEVNIYNVSDSG